MNPKGRCLVKIAARALVLAVSVPSTSSLGRSEAGTAQPSAPVSSNGANALMVAWYHPAGCWTMQGWQQKTCREILQRFNKEGIDFAFPSQTVCLATDDARQLKLQMPKKEVDTCSPQEGG